MPRRTCTSSANRMRGIRGVRRSSYVSIYPYIFVDVCTDSKPSTVSMSMFKCLCTNLTSNKSDTIKISFSLHTSHASAPVRILEQALVQSNNIVHLLIHPSLLCYIVHSPLVFHVQRSQSKFLESPESLADNCAVLPRVSTRHGPVIHQRWQHIFWKILFDCKSIPINCNVQC